MKRSVILPLLSIFILVVLVSLGCKQDKGNVVEETDSATDSQNIEPKVTIEVGEWSPAFPGAKARFISLEDGDVLDDNNVSVVVDVENYELGIQTETPRAKEIANSAKGQHVHIILDNDPYFADYEAGVPFDIGVLDEGPHTLVVFPSRSYHESVKSIDSVPYDIVNFYVGKKEGEFMLDESKPTVIYSRPKGKYEGKNAEKIMLDFYIINIEPSDGYQVKYTIRKNEPIAVEHSITIKEWKPAFVTGLTSGEYIITLQLLDKDGNLVEGPFNNTQRAVTVVAK
ncbi:MAG: hypothetical protein O6759_01975 [Candidatus Dadabacteria bacterium]|nr:hypothetical protein [Candidatus Dadabacteria bacterium]